MKKTVLRMILAHAAAATCAAGCSTGDLAHPNDERGVVEHVQSPVVKTFLVDVAADGSFTPATLQIHEGDVVTFRSAPDTMGVVAPLPPTFSVARVPSPAAAMSGACGASARAYDITNDDPELDNELTGPARKSSSGIFVLGPEDATGYIETPAGADCAAYAAASGVPAAVGNETWSAVVSTAGGNQLCRKYDSRGKKTNTNSHYLLESTWDDPAVTGAVVRINWKDFYVSTVSADGLTEILTPDFTTLDHELDRAAVRGKQVFLEVLAGAGTPPWIFDDYVPRCEGAGCVAPASVAAPSTGIAPKSVVPISTSDFGSDGDSGMPSAGSCGYKKTMGSPGDLAYRAAIDAVIERITKHVLASTTRYQALTSFKVTGLNFLTGETRLPKRCLEPTASANDPCFCNTRIWATPLGSTVEPFVPSPGQVVAPVNGGGYTAKKARDFLNGVENDIFVGLGRRKTMHFMLIQDGMPKVQDATHYDTYATIDPANLGYVDASLQTIPFDQQVIDLLDSGKRGLFFQVNPNGSPVSLAAHPEGALFSPMHAGLGPIHVDPLTGLNTCPQAHPVTMSGTPPTEAAALRAQFSYPTPLTNANYGDPGSGCPNQWVVREGYAGPAIGFQTVNDVLDRDALSATLWNGTLNSNMVFLEAYERAVWDARQATLAGATVLSTSEAGYALPPERQKSLAQWASELHARRRALAADPANAANAFMRDPYPDTYTFRFRKSLPAGTVETITFVDTAARCAPGGAPRAYGTIRVMGI